MDLDKTQFARLEQAILALAELPPLERQRKIQLLRTLENEKKKLLRSNPAIRREAA